MFNGIFPIWNANVLSGDRETKKVYWGNMKDKLNICLVSREYPPETGWGGIGTYTYHLAHGLSALGHQVHVVAQSLDINKDYRDGDVFVHRIAHRTVFYNKGSLKEFALRLEYSRRVNGKIQELIKKYGIDIVEGPNLAGEAFVYNFSRKTALVTRLHTHFSEVIDFIGWNKTLDLKLSCYLEDAVVLRSDLVLCSTRKHAETISWETGLSSKKIEIVPLGIPLSDLKNEQRGNGDLKVLFVGRLEKRKGVQVLLKAIPHVLDAVPEAVFDIVGRDTFVNSDFVSFHGNQKESFKARLIEGLPEKYRAKVRFLGHVTDQALAEYYRACDVFVAPSLYESFGLIYIEAMGHGKPVIGCGVGGVPEVVKDGETGLLVPPEDPQRLACGIIQLLKDPEMRREMGQKARKHAESCFTRKLMAERTVAVYRKAIGERKKIRFF